MRITPSLEKDESSLTSSEHDSSIQSSADELSPSKEPLAELKEESSDDDNAFEDAKEHIDEPKASEDDIAGPGQIASQRLEARGDEPAVDDQTRPIMEEKYQTLLLLLSDISREFSNCSMVPDNSSKVIKLHGSKDSVQSIQLRILHIVANMVSLKTTLDPILTRHIMEKRRDQLMEHLRNNGIKAHVYMSGKDTYIIARDEDTAHSAMQSLADVFAEEKLSLEPNQVSFLNSWDGKMLIKKLENKLQVMVEKPEPEALVIRGLSDEVDKARNELSEKLDIHRTSTAQLCVDSKGVWQLVQQLFKHELQQCLDVPK